jgi:hypothetical protein
MAIINIVAIHCDVCGDMSDPRATSAEARTVADADGWTQYEHRSGLYDLCPACSSNPVAAITGDWPPASTLLTVIATITSHEIRPTFTVDLDDVHD